MKKQFFTLMIAALAAGSCDTEGDSSLKSGKVDLSRMVAIGNSLTAGMVSGGWSYYMLENSYPSLIVKAAAGEEAVGDGSKNEPFVIARIADPGVITPSILGEVTNTGTLSNGTNVIRYSVIPGGIDIGKLAATNYNYEKSFNHLAVPGATARDNAAEVTGVTSTYGNPPFGNPLFSLPIRERAAGVVQAVSLKPTLALFWAGNNEILSSALAGGTRPTFPLEDAGSVRGFRSWHTEIITSLRQAGAKVVTATIPNVLIIPAVSMVGMVSRSNERAYIADLDGNGVYTDTLAFWGTDSGVTRKLNGTERVLMGWMGNEPEMNPARRFGLSQTDPLPDNLWLSDEEISAIVGALNQYNTYIRSWAAQADVAVVDVNALFSELAGKNGQSHTINGQTFTVDLTLPTGGFFSLDGVHPTGYGQKVLANAFIAEINQKLGGRIQSVSLEQPQTKVVAVRQGMPSGAPPSAALKQWMDLLGL